ncbi:MAG: DNA-3-methyladenine glycosylase I [Bifidobacteriaceae bacterium]|jgi:DNA-3-methyladenine glycosylase I|nr:DNA-3-methyladenine glycosylase I [Bifidobacteriaceae bacterium]
MSDQRRCPWGDSADLLMREYHDHQWGKPCHDESELFELLVLEGAQAGLSWRTILGKRENYRRAFDGFDVAKVAGFDQAKVEELIANPGIVRNRLKINSAITNARATLELGGLDRHLWGFVDGQPIINHWDGQDQLPASTDLSDRVGRDLKRRGFKFVGSTIVYSLLQSAGLVNDHLAWCDFR